MPRRAKGAHLYLKRAVYRPDGSLRKASVWVIRDGGRQTSTGCPPQAVGEAETALAEYLVDKHDPARRERDPASVPIADVLAIYVADRAPPENELEARARFDGRIDRLNEFWGARFLSDVSAATCREYVQSRGGKGGARRDLEDLRSAINHHARQGFHHGLYLVDLPDRNESRIRWLTRSEAAKLLWTCWRAREIQTLHRGAGAGAKAATEKRPWRHLCRFILMGLYTGSRSSAILTASWFAASGRSYIDLDRGVFYRLAEGARTTNKRQPPVPLPPRLVAHLKRWKAKGIAASHPVEWAGLPVRSVKTGFGRAVTAANLDGGVTPHTLRHTCATWLMQEGVPIWEAAGFLGMSPKMVEDVYGHHHPDHLRAATAALQSPRRRQTL